MADDLKAEWDAAEPLEPAVPMEEDLSAEWAESVPIPGALKSAAVKFAQGATKGWVDEAGGALGKSLNPEPIHVPGTPEGPGAYEMVRDPMRKEQKAAQGAHPWVSTIAQGVGELASDYLASKVGAPIGSLAYQTATGALSGAGNSDEKDTSGVLLDAGAGGGLAAGTYGLTRVAGAALRPMTARAREWLRSVGIEQGRRVLLNGADSLSSRVPTSDDAVVEAIRSGAIRPLGTTKGAFERLEALAAQQGDAYGAILEELERQGVRGPAASELADELMRRGAALERHTLNDALPQEYLNRAEQVIGKAGNAPNLGLMQNENLKRSAQAMAKYGRVEDTPLNEIRQDVASVLRQGTEDAIERAGRAAPPNSDVRHLAEGFVPVKQRLARLIEARRAAQRGAARGDQRRAFGLSDNMLAAAGLATGGPVTAAAWGLGNKLLRDRGTSAVAAGALGLSESQALRQLERVNPAALGRLAAPTSTATQSSFDRDENAVWVTELPTILAESPDALGKYAAPLVRAARQGPDALAAVDYALTKQDPEYQRIKFELTGGAR